MSILRDAPYPGMNFTVDIGKGNKEGPESGLLEVIFPEARIQIADYRNGNDRFHSPMKLPTLTHYGNLILRRGANGSMNWFDWWKAVRNGNANATTTVTVELLNEDRSDTVMTWRFLRAQPACHQFSPLNALAAETLIETLELAFESLEMD